MHFFPVYRKTTIWVSFEPEFNLEYFYFVQFDDFGRLLNQSWKVKRDLSNAVSNNKIDELYHFGIKNGALGGKLLGAGGAGFFLFYVPTNHQSKFIKSLKKNIVVPFKFEKEGSKIIFNDEKY